VCNIAFCVLMLPMFTCCAGNAGGEQAVLDITACWGDGVHFLASTADVTCCAGNAGEEQAMLDVKCWGDGVHPRTSTVDVADTYLARRQHNAEPPVLDITVCWGDGVCPPTSIADVPTWNGIGNDSLAAQATLVRTKLCLTSSAGVHPRTSTADV
jgi:hypothetical protein